MLRVIYLGLSIIELSKRLFMYSFTNYSSRLHIEMFQIWYIIYIHHNNYKLNIVA